VGHVKGAKPPQRADAAGFQKKTSIDSGKRSAFSPQSLPRQVLWTYDGCDLCGRVEVINGVFVAIDIDETIIGRFETLLQATRALPAGAAP
jgi:hypothetical protein